MKAIGLVLVIFCLSVPVGAQSQMTTGVIEGVIRDATGAALPGVTVTLTQSEPTQSLLSHVCPTYCD
jgi:hypothetical protein